MPTLSQANYYVVAVDLRGFGRTTSVEDATFPPNNLQSMPLIEHVRDLAALVMGLGYESVHCIAGQGIGAEIASLCCIHFHEFFHSCVMVSNAYKPPARHRTAVRASVSIEQTPIVTRSSDSFWDQRRRLAAHNEDGDDEIHTILASFDPPLKHCASTIPLTKQQRISMTLPKVSIPFCEAFSTSRAQRMRPNRQCHFTHGQLLSWRSCRHTTPCSCSPICLMWSGRL